MGRVVRNGGRGGITPATKKVASPRSSPSPKRRPYFTTTDTGNAERFVYVAGIDFKYVPAWETHIIWTGSVWRKDKGGGGMLRLTKRCLEDLKDEAKTTQKEAEMAKVDSTREKVEKRAKGLFGWWRQSEARPRREAMIKLSHGERGVDVEHSQLDSNPWLMGVANGVVDLKTGKLLINDRKYLLTKRTPVRFEPKSKAPKWQAFLKQVVPDPDIREFVQRFVGYCLTGMATERMFLILFGGGRNGKSVFLHALQEMLGPYAISTAPGLLMSRQNEAHPTEVADLFQVRLAVANEVKKGRVFDEEQVKRLTGNDVLKARKMREDFWEFEPTFKLMIAANHKPQVRDDSDSFWDRLGLIPFKQRIADEKVDPLLLTKLKAELPGILAWAVEGCLRWQKMGLKRPKAVMDATKEYRSSEDTLGKFFEEVCRFGMGYETSTGALAAAVKRWCEGNNLTYTFKEKDLAEKLVEKGAVRDRLGGKDARVRGWKGLGLVTYDKDGAVEPKKKDAPKPSKVTNIETKRKPQPSQETATIEEPEEIEDPPSEPVRQVNPGRQVSPRTYQKLRDASRPANDRGKIERSDVDPPTDDEA